MDIESLNAINKDISLSLLTTLEVILVTITLLALAGFALYLVGLARFCFEETRQPARRQIKPAPEPPDIDEYDPLAVLAALDDDLDDSLTGGLSRREPAFPSSA